MRHLVCGLAVVLASWVPPLVAQESQPVYHCASEPRVTTNYWDAQARGCTRAAAQGGLGTVAAGAAQEATGKTVLFSIPLVLLAALWALQAVRAKLRRPDDASFAKAAGELDSGAKDGGVWARVYAQSGGDESKARAAYIRERARAIAQASTAPDPAPSPRSTA